MVVVKFLDRRRVLALAPRNCQTPQSLQPCQLSRALGTHALWQILPIEEISRAPQQAVGLSGDFNWREARAAAPTHTCHPALLESQLLLCGLCGNSPDARETVQPRLELPGFDAHLRLLSYHKHLVAPLPKRLGRHSRNPNGSACRKTAGRWLCNLQKSIAHPCHQAEAALPPQPGSNLPHTAGSCPAPAGLLHPGRRRLPAMLGHAV